MSMFQGAGPSGIEAGAIIGIIFAGLLPVIVVAGLAIWLLGYYGRDRACCCCGGGRKKKRQQEATLEEGVVERQRQPEMAVRPSTDSYIPKPQPTATRSGDSSRYSKVSRHSSSGSEDVTAFQQPRGFV